MFKKRAHLRAVQTFPVKYRLPWSLGWCTAYTDDISVSGLSFKIPGGFWVTGCPVEVQVESAIASFHSKARVVRATRGGDSRQIGLHFDYIPLDAKESLDRYISVFAKKAV